MISFYTKYKTNNLLVFSYMSDDYINTVFAFSYLVKTDHDGLAKKRDKHVGLFFR